MWWSGGGGGGGDDAMEPVRMMERRWLSSAGGVGRWGQGCWRGGKGDEGEGSGGGVEP